MLLSIEAIASSNQADLLTVQSKITLSNNVIFFVIRSPLDDCLYALQPNIRNCSGGWRFGSAECVPGKGMDSFECCAGVVFSGAGERSASGMDGAPSLSESRS